MQLMLHRGLTRLRELGRAPADVPIGADQDRPGAADAVLVAVIPEVWRTLVVERGWTPDAYEEWLGALLVTQLLR